MINQSGTNGDHVSQTKKDEERSIQDFDQDKNLIVKTEKGILGPQAEILSITVSYDLLLALAL